MNLDKIPRMPDKFEGRVQSSAFRPRAAMVYSTPVSPCFLSFQMRRLTGSPLGLGGDFARIQE